MNPILDDESYSVEDRLEMAKEMLKLKDMQINQLEYALDKFESAESWKMDQAGYKRMGL